MTDQDPTAPAAVERLAKDMQEHMPFGRGAATLRALAAERDALRAKAVERLDPETHADKFDPSTGGYVVTFEKYAALSAALEAEKVRADAAETELDEAVGGDDTFNELC